jgi:hypothetical protein
LPSGSGFELRRPLDMTIVGGLIVSQVLTFYTMPVIYLLRHKLGGGRAVQTLPDSLRLGRPATGWSCPGEDSTFDLRLGNRCSINLI